MLETNSIPVSIIIMTRNNDSHLRQCLDSVLPFNEIFVVDSQSTDQTLDVAKQSHARIISYEWDGSPMKKKQWCLTHLPFKNNWVFYLDADEIMTRKCAKEIQGLVHDPHAADGYFVTAQHVLRGQKRNHGMYNRKLAFFKKDSFYYPEIKQKLDHDIGEVEGHYQPLPVHSDSTIARLSNTIEHHAFDDMNAYTVRHERYARWEAEMTLKERWPNDPIGWRQHIKRVLRQSLLRPAFLFFYSFIVKAGFLDGINGYRYARYKSAYARRVLFFLKDFNAQYKAGA